MRRVTPSFAFLAGLALITSPGRLQAQDAKANRAATVPEAAKVLDLATFPLMKDAVSQGPRRLASLSYAARSDVRGAFAFQKKTLESLGWEELPGGFQSDESCSGVFGKNGFAVSVSAGPAGGPGSAGVVNVMFFNHGNVDLGKLPVPPGAKREYSFPSATGYVTERPARETAAALRKLLTDAGWEPYGTAGDSQFFKQNAVQITVTSSVAPAQGGRTMIQMTSVLMSADLPAPPNLIDAHYADTTKALSLETDMSSEALTAFYREALGKAGWEPTTEKPIKDRAQEMLIFRNDAKDILTLKIRELKGKRHADLDHQTAAEFDEAMKRAEAQEAKRKSQSEERRKMAAAKAAREIVTLAIDVPAGAKDVERSKDDVEFKLDKGKAKAAVEAIRDDLVKDGWKQGTTTLNRQAGVVILTKKGGTVTINYVDTGVTAAEVRISTFRAIIEEPKAK